MSASWLRKWLPCNSKPARGKQRRPHRFIPRLEELEPRIALSTFMVNDAGDAPVRNFKDENAQTDAGTVTLRSAIQQTDYDGGGTILFASGLTILPGSALPPVFAPTRIDGTLGGTTPQVQIQGGESIGVGLALGGGSTVRGLVLNGFTSAAITFTTASGAGTSNILIEDNYLGTDRTGTKAAGTEGAGIHARPEPRQQRKQPECHRHSEPGGLSAGRRQHLRGPELYGQLRLQRHQRRAVDRHGGLRRRQPD